MDSELAFRWIAVFSIVLCGPGCTSNVQPGPKLALPDAGLDYDLGIVVSGEERRVTVRLANEGTEELRISAVRSSCGCIVADYPAVLAAGDSGEIAIVLRTAGFSRGAFVRKLVAVSNDAARPNVTVVVRGEVVVPFVADPAHATLEGVVGSALSGVVSVHWRYGPLATELTVASRRGHVVVTNVRPVVSGREYEVTLWAEANEKADVVGSINSSHAQFAVVAERTVHAELR